jgi:Protein of unknown function (DUF2817)
MTISKYFSESYSDAREKFLDAAQSRNAKIQSNLYPKKGPTGEELFVDVAQIGRPDSKRLLIVISGTHGVEGFCGSACQTAWLIDGTARELRDIGVYLVHGLNPYGFAWHRRVNEENVDLNRNFLSFGSGPLPDNPEYKELENLLNPRVLDHSNLGVLDPALRQWFGSQDKIRKFKAAVGKGQYEFQKGIIFGGSAPTWSHQFLKTFIDALPSPLAAGCVIDIHTGLGEVGQLEIFTEESGTKFERLQSWFERKTVTTLGRPESLGYCVTGSIFNAFATANADTPWHCAALEFGTRPLVEVLLALQADNWLHCFGGKNSPLSAQIFTLMKNAFSDTSDDWQQNVVTMALDIIRQATAGIQQLQADKK